MDSVASIAHVDVRVADLEPVASFIKAICEADAVSRKMSKAEAEALPGHAVHALTLLQEAVRRLDIGTGPRDFADKVHKHMGRA